MGRLKDVWGSLLVVIAVLILYSQLPLGSALQFGGDEGYELMPSFLVSKGFKLYRDIWSDQPPVLFMLLGWAFKVWGPSILVGRLIAAGFGLLLFAMFFQLVYLRIGRRAAFLATFFLLASPGILQISVSVMQEVPAFGAALASALLLFRWRKHPYWGWLLASGVVMGVALGIKLTAALVAPAMIMEMVLAWQTNQVQPKAHGKTPTLALLYRLCIEQGLLTRAQIAPNTFRRVVKQYELLKPEDDSGNKHRLAFAKAHANEMWQAAQSVRQ